MGTDSTKTKCPLFYAAALGSVDREPDHSQTDCMKGRCAVWNAWFGMCSQAVDAHLRQTEQRLANERRLNEKGDQ